MKSELVSAFRSAALWAQSVEGKEEIKKDLYTIGFPFYFVGLVTLYPATKVVEEVVGISRFSRKAADDFHEKVIAKILDPFVPVALLGLVEVIAGVKWLRRNRG